MTYPGPMSEFPINLKVVPEDPLPREELKRLTQLKPYLFILDVVFDACVIASAIAFSEYFYFNWAAYIIAVVIIGSRINAFSVLMHDTAHFRAFKSKTLNYIFGEPLAWTLLLTMEGYRRNHLPHHTHLNTLDDPDWVRKIPQQGFHYPKKRWQFIGDVMTYLSGIGYIGLAKAMLKSEELKSVPKHIKMVRAAFYLVVLGICIYTGTVEKLLLYWIVPLVTVFNTLNWLRSLGEHLGNLEYDHPYHYARSMKVSWLEAFILSPHGINYHLEHHLYPHIPYYNLGKLHNMLIKQPVFSSKAHITHGIFTGLLKEILAAPAGPSFAEMVSRQRKIHPATSA